MAGKINLELVTPSQRVLSQEVDEVRCPAGDVGSFGIRPGHEPLVVRNRPGALVVVNDGVRDVFAVGEGFVQVAHDHVLVLAKMAEHVDDIDLAEARVREAEAARKLRELGEHDTEYDMARAELERSAARVHAVTLR